MWTDEPAALGQDDVPGDHDLLGRGGDAGQAEPLCDPALVHRPALEKGPVLAVVDDESTGFVRGGHGPAHDPAVCDGPSVVRKSDRTRRDEAGHVDELRALRAPRHRGDGQDVGQTGPPGFGQDALRDLGPVVDGIGVGHGADRRESAADGRPDAGGDGLLGLVTGFPQMDVEVDEAGDKDETAGVDGSVRRDPAASADRRLSCRLR